MSVLGQILSTTEIGENIKYVTLRCLDANTAQTVSTTLGGDFVWPFSGTISEIFAHQDTAGVTGTITVDVNKNGTTIFSTKITMDSNEKDSSTAATPPVISVASFAKGDILTVDIDGVQTTPGNGLSIRMKTTVTSYS